MKKSYLHIFERYVFYVLAIMVLSLSVYSEYSNALAYSLDDYIFLLILASSFILINQYSIRLKDTNLIFNDFIIILLYIKFHIHITIIILFLSYLAISLIDYKNSKNQNLVTENRNVFNNSLFILSTYAAHLGFSFLSNIYGIENYQLVSVIIFAFLFLLSNYLLFCADLSFKQYQLVLITLQDGLYYVILNFLLCTVMAVISIYLYSFYGYIPIAVLTAFIIFISFSMNRIDKLTVRNKNLKLISECITFLISQPDFKTKLHHVIEVIEEIVPFEFCSIYLFRDKHTWIYPICHKTEYLIELQELKFLQTNDNEIYRRALVGNAICIEAAAVSNNFSILKSLSKPIKNTLLIPVKDFNSTIGFIFIGLNHLNDLSEETELLLPLGHHIGIVNSHITNLIRNNPSLNKNLDGLARYMDYNIKNKIFFTLAVIEISNYNQIIEAYNIDFYEAYKNEIGRLVSKTLSNNDYILCFEKEDIYLVFNLLDYKNSMSKLEEISRIIESFSLRGIEAMAKTLYAACEYPVEGISSDELFAKANRKLHKEKMLE